MSLILELFNYFILFYFILLFYLQETGNSKFLIKGNSPSIFGYEFVFLRANSKIPGMRGLYFGVHNSCSYTAKNVNYN